MTPAPRGAVTLIVDGRPVRVTGGPFDSLPEGARGLCLEPRAARVAEAAWRLDVPDFGVPEAAALRDVLQAMLADMRAAPDAAYHVGCRAGLGRTGLALACLAAMTGIEDPVRWLRATYDPGAVETDAQQAMVAAFAAAARSQP
jgi:protein-tyrosine phosphatase